mgnify:CR=1 FL=1
MTSSSSAHQVVSVIIPAYNMAEYLASAIRSVLVGTYDDVDVICVDDGSTDDTADVAYAFTHPESEEYDPRVRYMRQPNQGKSAAVNQGIEAMHGAYFTVLDADDELPPTSLERRVQALQATEDADLAIGSFAVINEDGETVGNARLAPVDPTPEALRHSFYLSYKTPFHFSACLLRQELVERVGPFDTELTRCQDGDYAIRSLMHTHGVVSIKDVVYLYRKHRDERSDRIRMRLATLQHRPTVLLKNFSFPQNYLYAFATAAFDIAKLFYEVFSNYRK